MKWAGEEEGIREGAAERGVPAEGTGVDEWRAVVEARRRCKAIRLGAMRVGGGLPVVRAGKAEAKYLQKSLRLARSKRHRTFHEPPHIPQFAYHTRLRLLAFDQIHISAAGVGM